MYNEDTEHLKGKSMDKDQEIERLQRQLTLREDRIATLLKHIETLDRQVTKLIHLDNEKDEFILKIRKELISRL